MTGTTALRLEVLPDATLHQKGPGRANNGNFVLTELEVLRVVHTSIEDLPIQQRARIGEVTL